MRIVIVIPQSEYTPLSKNTWDRVEVRDVVTHYYDDFDEKLKEIDSESIDFVFHVDQFSYIHKIRLCNYALTLPWKGVFTGNERQAWISFDVLKSMQLGAKPAMGNKFQSVDFFKTYNDTEPYHYNCFYEYEENRFERVKSAMDFLFKKHFG